MVMLLRELEALQPGERLELSQASLGEACGSSDIKGDIAHKLHALAEAENCALDLGGLPAGPAVFEKIAPTKTVRDHPD